MGNSEIELSEQQKRVLKWMLCGYCGETTSFFKSSAEFYGGRDFGPVWACRECQAWVGCHGWTTKPLWRVADKWLREWKSKAHEAFDPVWKNSDIPRKEAYFFLSQILGIPPKYCHIGMFSEATCRKIVWFWYALEAMIEEKYVENEEKRKKNTWRNR